MIRRVVNVPPAVAEETVVSTPSTSELVEDDAPPVISRFDNSTYPPSTVSPPPVPGPHRIVLNRAAPVVSNNQKVLLIRRNDGTTQYLRPVANPTRGIEPACRIGEAPPTMRRVVASVTAGRPGTVVRTVAAGQPTRVVRVGPGGQQIVNRLSGTRVMATRTPQGLEASTLRQSQAPVGAVQQQTRIVQRVLTRGGATMAMGQRIVSSHEDIGLTRPLKNPREFGYKPRVVPDVARSSYSSRPYRFDFESNEDEERAIAEAIAREEELMAQEEEENKNNQERQWNYPRIIDKFGQVGTAMLHNLARQPLQYNSNLMPTKEDTQEQKQIKQTLDSLVTQVCRWDKQFGWFKNHQKKPKNRAEMDKMKSRRMFSNQRELMLAEHVERLRREINKRRTRLENDAEQECGLQTPWRKGKAKTPKSKRPVKKAPNAPIVNPAEISLGGDSIDWMKKEIKIEEDELVEDVCSSSQPPSKKSRLEVETSPRRKPASVPRSDRVLRTRMNSHSSVEEGSSKKDAPKKRGRPKKEALSSQDSEDSDTAGVDYGIPEGMTDPKAPHCICRKPYNSKRFYISCDMCNGWFHGKCVGVKSKDCESLTSWACPDCKQQTEQIQQNDLYCLCQKPYDDREFYVGCDKCEDWFHPECVGITKEYAESIAEYVCPPCRTAAEQSATDGYESTASEASTSSSSPPLSRADYPKVWQLLDTISHHKMAWPFKEPVDLAKHPDYTNLVKRPMDLKTIQNKLERLEYIKLKDFSYDCNLMFENARAYYTKDSPIYLCATTLEKIFEDNLIEVKKEMARAYNIDRRKPSESHTVDSSLDIDTDQLIELQHDGIANGNFDITQYI